MGFLQTQDEQCERGYRDHVQGTVRTPNEEIGYNWYLGFCDPASLNQANRGIQSDMREEVALHEGCGIELKPSSSS